MCTNENVFGTTRVASIAKGARHVDDVVGRVFIGRVRRLEVGRDDALVDQRALVRSAVSARRRGEAGSRRVRGLAGTSRAPIERVTEVCAVSEKMVARLGFRAWPDDP